MSEHKMLLGSSLLPSLIGIRGEDVPLGDVVNGALKDSELTTDEWNRLSSLDRETLLARRIYKMRGEEGGNASITHNELSLELYRFEKDLQAFFDNSDPTRTDTCEGYFKAQGRRTAYAEAMRWLRAMRERLTEER